MPKKTPLEVIKKAPESAGIGAPRGNGNALKSGVYADLARRNLDGRTKLARALRRVEAEMVSALGGDVSPQEKMLVDRVVFKLARCTMFEAASLAGEAQADEHYLAWSNSLRLDLQALGLARRAKKIMDLKEYIDGAAS